MKIEIFVLRENWKYCLFHLQNWKYRSLKCKFNILFVNSWKLEISSINSWKLKISSINSWKLEILFVNSWKLEILFVNSWRILEGVLHKFQFLLLAWKFCSVMALLLDGMFGDFEIIYWSSSGVSIPPFNSTIYIFCMICSV